MKSIIAGQSQDMVITVWEIGSYLAWLLVSFFPYPRPPSITSSCPINTLTIYSSLFVSKPSNNTKVIKDSARAERPNIKYSSRHDQRTDLLMHSRYMSGYSPQRITGKGGGGGGLNQRQVENITQPPFKAGRPPPQASRPPLQKVDPPSLFTNV